MYHRVQLISYNVATSRKSLGDRLWTRAPRDPDMRRLIRSLALTSAILTGAVLNGAESEGIDYFERYVRPVLATQCYACHSAQAPQLQSGLRVDSRQGLLDGGTRGPAIMPGNPEASRIVQVLRPDSELRMPPGGSLTDQEVERIAAWIRMGAPYPEPLATETGRDAAGADRHWSLVPPKNLQPPASATGWSAQPIDRFVEARLAQEGLTPSEQASPRTLVRRIYYDLTGLPPTAEEIEAFERAPTEEAYAALVDELLDSDRFGERWARHWLDIVRYSDDGAQARPFPISWTYRDWVVRAFNEDLPYDQFVIKQLAADLEGGDRRDLAALGMLTVGINLVRPTDVVENLDDRIDVITRGLQGLSVSCARCHDHKFDPIPQKDYYSLYGVLLNSPDVVSPVPIEDVPAGAVSEFFQAKLATRRGALDRFREERLKDHIREFRTPEVLARYLQFAWESRDAGSREVEALTKEEDLNLYLLNRWRDYLNGLVGPSVAAFAALDEPDGAARLAREIVAADSDYRWPDPRREALRLALRGTGSPTDIPVADFWWVQNEGDSNVMKGLRWQYEAVMRNWGHRGGPAHAMVVADAKVPRPAYVFNRGNQHDLGEQVRRKFLTALPGPSEFRDGSGRLELARVIASAENPLTARVFVNRVWVHLFGEGLVRTPSDFGLRGNRPSHPELLDFLAMEFVADDWSIKRLIRRVAMSRTYRQDSVDLEEGRTADPANQLLWRQNRIRLDFEALRDTMLAAAGRLDTRMGGPPFELQARPSSPRRTLYTYVSREAPSALMRTFDFSNPEEHTPKRQLTTVPQQALFLMNSPFLAEQARAIAKRCPQEDQCVEKIYRHVLRRSPTPAERDEAIRFLESSPPAAARSGDGGRRWLYGMARLDTQSGTVENFQKFAYRVGDRLQPAPMMPSPGGGRVSLTATGGYPGDSLDSAAVRRWTAPESMKVSITGTLEHNLGDQGRRFDHSNGVRGWIVSSEQGVLASWTVRGFEVETVIRDLRIAEGEILDFVVDSRADYEADTFRWAPVIEQALSDAERASGMEVRSWGAEDGFPRETAEPLSPSALLAQTLLMTNEFAFRD